MPPTKGLVGALAVLGLVTVGLALATSGLAQGEPLLVEEVTTDPDPIGPDDDEVTLVATIADNTSAPDSPYSGPYTVHFNITGDEETRVATVNRSGTDFLDGDQQEISSTDTEEDGGTWEPSAGVYTVEVTVVPNADDGPDHVNTTGLELGPDLVVQQDATVTPEDPKQGDDVTFEVTVGNEGPWNVDGEQVDEVAVQVDVADETFDATVDPLASNATATVELGPWSAEPDQHTVTADVDPDDAIAEVDDDNQADLTTLDVEETDPDLAVNSLFTEPPFPSGENPIGVQADLQNVGDADAPATVARLSLDGEPVGDKEVPALPAGEATPVTWEVETDVGQHTLDVVVDPNNDLEDPEPANDEGSEEMTVGPLLGVQDLQLSPEDPEDGDEVLATFTVTNDGAAVDGSVTVVFTADGEPVDEATIDGLDTSAERTVELGPWDATGGDHTLAVTVDPEDALREADEDGNTAERDVTVGFGGPEISLADVGLARDDVAPGDGVPLVATVVNDGPVRAEGIEVTFRVDDATLGDPVDAGALEPGEQTTVSSTNWTADAGRHAVTVEATVDGGDGAEDARSFSIGPDLTPAEVTASTRDPSLGETVDVEVLVENLGTQAVTDAEVALAADGDRVAEAGTGNLSARSSTTVDLTWTPEDDPDQLVVRVDASDDVDPENDARTLNLTVNTDVADLVAGALTVDPDPPSPDDNVTITLNVTNEGSADAGLFEVAFRVDGEPIGQAPVDGLRAGESTDVTGPSWTPSANATNLTAFVDPDGAEPAADRGNNERTLGVDPDDGSGVPGPGALLALATAAVAALVRRR
jgi:subtilase family serine protease